MGYEEASVENFRNLHIPRPSLSSSSQSSNSLRRSSTDGIRSHNGQRRHHHHHHHHRKGSSSHSTSTSSSIHSKSRSQNLEQLHRGSRSSQGSSSEGNLSLHSASSLLLSVQNLEKFTKLQEKNSRLPNNRSADNLKKFSPNNQHYVIEVDETVEHQHQLPAGAAAKAKEFDSVSIASSAHFTMVNGFGRSNIRTKSNSICRQGRQITVLIVTMSSLFMIGIILCIYLMDRRAKSMPAYHQ